MIESKDISGFLMAFISFIRNAILYVFLSLRKYFLPALAAFVIVLGASYYFRKAQRPYYDSQMVCEFTNVTKRSIGEEIVKLDKLVKTGSYNALANTLSIPLAQAQSIISIEAKNSVGSPLHEDITETKNPVYINVTASNNTVFKPLQVALINYLNSTSPFRERRDVMELEIIDNTVRFIEKDIHQTDSIITAYGNFLRHTRAVTDSAAGFSNIAALLKYKSELEAKHAQNKWRINELKYNVEVLHGFLPADYPTQGAKFSWTVAISLALAASCILAVVCNLLLQPNGISSIADAEPEVVI